MRPSLLVSAFLLSSLPSAAQGAVHVVDYLDPTAHDSVQSAVNAAADGDVILVRNSSSSVFTVAGKSLVIAADTIYPPYFWDNKDHNHTMTSGSSHTWIHDLQPGQRVVLRGLSFGGLELEDVAGQVWLEQASVNWIAPAMRAADVEDLVLHDVQLFGPDDYVDAYASQTAGMALELYGTRAALHAVTAHGGNGLDFQCGYSGFCWNSSGWTALSVSGGQLWLADAELTGGNGGEGGVFFGSCYTGGSGGHGLSLTSGASAALHDANSVGGAAATGPSPRDCTVWGGGGDGTPGAAFDVEAGSTLQAYAGDVLALHAASPLREHQTLTVTLAGRAGTNVLLLASPDSARLDLAAVHGPLLTGVPSVVLPLGKLPASGMLALHAEVPELGAGVQAASWTLQTVSLEDGAYFAGPATSVLFLDAGL